mgnify:CR=1 FL=1
MTRGRGDPRKIETVAAFRAARDYPTEFKIVSTGVNSVCRRIYSEPVAAGISTKSGSPAVDALGKAFQASFVELLLDELFL